MNVLFDNFGSEIKTLIEFSVLPFAVFLISLAFVFLLGRMLLLIKQDNYRLKNLIAFLTQICCYIFYFVLVTEQIITPQVIWLMIVYASLSVFFYTTIGFRIYDDIDSLQDRFFKKKNKK